MLIGRAAGHRSAPSAAASLLHRRWFAKSPLAAASTGLRGASSTKSESTTAGGRISGLGALALAGSSLLAGYCIGTSHHEHLTDLNRDRELPKGERG